MEKIKKYLLDPSFMLDIAQAVVAAGVAIVLALDMIGIWSGATWLSENILSIILVAICTLIISAFLERRIQLDRFSSSVHEKLDTIKEGQMGILSAKAESKITFKEFLDSTIALLKLIQENNYKPDYIVGVDRNGSIVGGILSGYLGSRGIITATTEAERKKGGSINRVVSEAYTPTPDSLLNKKLLIVTCYIVTGAGLQAVHDYYSNLPESNRPKQIKTASVYITQSSIFKPDFYINIVGKDIDMPIDTLVRSLPWMQNEWKRK